MFNDHCDHKNVCFIFDGSGKDCVSVEMSLLVHHGFIKSGMSSKFGQIRSRNAELPLRVWKNTHRFIV